MQASLTLAATLDTQHSRLVTMDEFIKRLPFNYPSYYQIHTGQLKQAIETLERRRALLRSEILGLRTSINQIRMVDPHLADNFVATVDRHVETLTLAHSRENNVYGRDGDIEGMDLFGRLVGQQRTSRASNHHHPFSMAFGHHHASPQLSSLVD